MRRCTTVALGKKVEQFVTEFVERTPRLYIRVAKGAVDVLGETLQSLGDFFAQFVKRLVKPKRHAMLSLPLFLGRRGEQLPEFL